MPSPVGHMLGGMAAAWLVAGAPRFTTDSAAPTAGWWREAVLFSALGALPDVDLLFGAHSGPTHSIGAAVIAGVVFGALARRGRWHLQAIPTATAMLAATAAYASHVLLDWLSSDTTAPIGVMALWPFRSEHYESSLHLFLAITRRYDQGLTFVRQNGLALVRELVILVPVLVLVIVLRPRVSRRRVQE